MTALTRNPTNQNFLQPNKFTLNFSRLPNTQFFCQSTFYIDEELVAWREIHDWIRAMTFPTDFSEYRNLGRLSKSAGVRESLKPQYSDASITLLSSSNKPYFRFKFYDVFPTTLSTFIMSATDSPESQMTADGTFRYSYYDIEKLF
jgi:hypothetical protein